MIKTKTADEIVAILSPITIRFLFMVSTRKVHWKTQNVVQKPEYVGDYNESMSSVDKVDTQISFTASARESIKLCNKCFLYPSELINVETLICGPE